jgi:hypothetical protein
MDTLVSGGMIAIIDGTESLLVNNYDLIGYQLEAPIPSTTLFAV